MLTVTPQSQENEKYYHKYKEKTSSSTIKSKQAATSRFGSKVPVNSSIIPTPNKNTHTADNGIEHSFFHTIKIPENQKETGKAFWKKVMSNLEIPKYWWHWIHFLHSKCSLENEELLKVCEKALETIDKKHQKEDEYAKILLVKCKFLYACHQWEKAVQIYEMMFKNQIGTNLHFYWNNYATILHKTGDNNKSIEVLNFALESISFSEDDRIKLQNNLNHYKQDHLVSAVNSVHFASPSVPHPPTAPKQPCSAESEEKEAAKPKKQPKEYSNSSPAAGNVGNSKMSVDLLTTPSFAHHNPLNEALTYSSLHKASKSASASLSSKNKPSRIRKLNPFPSSFDTGPGRVPKLPSSPSSSSLHDHSASLSLLDPPSSDSHSLSHFLDPSASTLSHLHLPSSQFDVSLSASRSHTSPIPSHLPSRLPHLQSFSSPKSSSPSPSPSLPLKHVQIAPSSSPAPSNPSSHPPRQRHPSLPNPTHSLPHHSLPKSQISDPFVFMPPSPPPEPSHSLPSASSHRTIQSTASADGKVTSSKQQAQRFAQTESSGFTGAPPSNNEDVNQEEIVISTPSHSHSHSHSHSNPAQGKGKGNSPFHSIQLPAPSMQSPQAQSHPHSSKAITDIHQALQSTQEAVQSPLPLHSPARESGERSKRTSQGGSGHPSSLQVQQQQQFISPNPTSKQRTSTSGGHSYKFPEISVHGKKYACLTVLGKGGSSRVYKVYRPSSDKNRRASEFFALKQVNLTDQDETTCAGFRSEIELLISLRGESRVVNLIDYEISSKRLSIVLELGEVDLRSILLRLKNFDKNSNPINYIRLYWQQMLEAVQVIHNKRIVHGDLKPANFVCFKGILKLIDFGIAGAIQSNTTNIKRESMIGTLNYIAPEACQLISPTNQQIKMGVSSDIWSLGIILYEMVYHTTPFASISHIVLKIQRISGDSPIEFPPNPTNNPHVVDVMKACLQRNPKLRPKVSDLLNHPFLL